MTQHPGGDATPVLFSTIFPERDTEEIAETLQVDINQVGAQSTVLAKAEDKKLIRICGVVVKYMRPTLFLQKNVSKGVNNRQM